MTTTDQRLAELHSQVPEISPTEAARRMASGALMLDVREADELAAGSPRGALHVPRSFLELRIEEKAPDRDQALLLLCEVGIRSLFAAASLQQLGYREVYSVAGGYSAWKAAGLPCASPPSRLDPEDRRRYARQILLPEIGEAGQQKLGSARLLLIGAGGLGSPAALYLAAAGVGTLGIVDDDSVELGNLHRQVLHSQERLGIKKTESARHALYGLNPSVRVVSHETRLTSSNVESIFQGYDLVVDGSDNFPTRYLASDACLKLGLPHVYGAVERYSGQIGVFWPAAPDGRGPCYRCLFPEPPPPELAPSCAEAGVLGVVPGIIGVAQATEALKLILGIGRPLIGRLLLYDALGGSWRELAITPDPACRYCREGADFPGYIDYEAYCRGT